jgi:hypothetical protein
MKALLIHKCWLDLILSGKKTWEIRGKATATHGPIALIQSKSGMIYGVCELASVRGPVSIEDLQSNCHLHCIPRGDIPHVVHYERPYAWILKNARRLKVPVRYEHPSGAVVWVNLSEQVARRVKNAGHRVP